VRLLISRRTLGKISVTIRGHPHALPNLPASQKVKTPVPFALRLQFGESQVANRELMRHFAGIAGSCDDHRTPLAAHKDMHFWLG
jgi:hypothetical protein